MAGVVVSDDVIAEILSKLPVKSLLRFNCVCKTGSCNGLVCVDHKNKSSPDRSGLILWNPSTRKFRRLPRPGCYSVQGDLSTYAWLGYDELIDDYKLVWLNCSGLRRPPIVTELDVFTLKSNTWRRPPVDHITVRGINLFKREDRFNPISIGVLSNGAIHWITCYFPLSDGSAICILALDLATEKFRLLKFSHAPLGFTAWVGSVLGGCLCLCSNGYEDGCCMRDLWMMKEYGVESSWTKLLSIPLTFIRPAFQFLSYYPILFLKEEGKEIVAMSYSVREQSGGADRAVIVKLRVEGQV